MYNLARLAKHPLLAPYFEVVHPIFWPILLWQLMKVSEHIHAAGSCEALIHISWWGGVRIDYLGDSIHLWKKPEPTKPDWSHPVWETHLPPNMAVFLEDPLQADETCLQGAAILPRLRGGIVMSRSKCGLGFHSFFALEISFGGGLVDV